MSVINESVLRYVRNKVIPTWFQRAVKSPLVAAVTLESWIARRWSSAAHKRMMLLEWGLPPQPEFFDHAIDLHHAWTETRNSLWVERGIFGGLALQNQGYVLELACGDGFNAKHFYSLRAATVWACDSDPEAIRLAKRKNHAPNIEYIVQDIREGLPGSGFLHNVVWDGAIEHFTRDEIDRILPMISERIQQKGILSGYTVVEKDDEKALSHHQTFFESKEDLASILKKHLPNVTVFETIYPSRHNLYFWASNGTALPFSEEWPQVTRTRPDNGSARLRAK